MPEIHGLSGVGEDWLRSCNVEMVRCWLPTFDQIARECHSVEALGNDGVDLVFEFQSVSDEMDAVFQLHWIDKALVNFRYQETIGEYLG